MTDKPKPGHVKKVTYVCPYCGRELNPERLKTQNLFYCTAVDQYVRLCTENNGNYCNGVKTCSILNKRNKHYGDR